MEVPSGSAPFPDEVDGDPIASPLLEREGHSCSYRDHRPQVADHAQVVNARLLVEVRVMVRALPPAAKAIRFS